MRTARFWAVPIVMVLVGCVTGGPKEPGNMPIQYAPLFKACAPADGGAIVTVLEDGVRRGSATLDWIAKAGLFQAELTGPIGQTLLTMTLAEGGPVKIAGSVRRDWPPMKVTKDGFFEVDGHFVGLKTTEVACVFQAALPPGWLMKFSYSQKDGVQQRLTFADGKRDMTVTFQESGSYCAEVAWSVMLIFKRSLSWCVTTRDAPKNGNVQGLGDYSLEWTKLDEQAL